MNTPSLALTAASKPLRMLAVASNCTPASNTLSAIEHALAFFAGYYGARFQPAPNAALVWAAVLEGHSADVIAKACLAHARNTERRHDGSAQCDWPPTPGNILALIRSHTTLNRPNLRIYQ